MTKRGSITLDDLSYEMEERYEDGSLFQVTADSNLICKYSVLDNDCSLWNNIVEKGFNKCVTLSVTSNCSRLHPNHAHKLSQLHSMGSAPELKKFIHEIIDNKMVHGYMESQLQTYLEMVMDIESRESVNRFIHTVFACLGYNISVDFKEIDEAAILADEMRD